jgi:hypothetical protein
VTKPTLEQAIAQYRYAEASPGNWIVYRRNKPIRRRFPSEQNAQKYIQSQAQRVVNEIKARSEFLSRFNWLLRACYDQGQRKTTFNPLALASVAHNHEDDDDTVFRALEHNRVKLPRPTAPLDLWFEALDDRQKALALDVLSEIVEEKKISINRTPGWWALAILRYERISKTPKALIEILDVRLREAGYI